MRDFFELVLQNIPATQVIAALRALVARSAAVLSLECSADSTLSEQLEQDVLSQVLAEESELALLLRLSQLRLGKLVLEKPLLHLHKYDGLFEIDLSFAQAPGFGASEVAELQAFAQEFAQTHAIPGFFAGIQAADEDDEDDVENKQDSKRRCYFSQTSV